VESHSFVLSVMLGNVPVVDGSVRVASGEDLDVTVGVPHVRLAIIDVVLVKGFMRLHNCALIHLETIEENSATTKGIRTDSGGFHFAKAGINRACELPRAILLSLEDKGGVVVATANVSIFTDKDARQD